MWTGSSRSSAIAAALSGDAAMQAAYRSGDPYLAFAKQAGAVPARRHQGDARAAARAVQAVRPGGPVRHGGRSLGLAHRPAPDRRARAAAGPPRDLSDVLALVRRRRSTPPCCTGSLHTVFGWHVHVGEKSNPRSLRNFPMQANGAEMMRLGCLPGNRARRSRSAPRCTTLS